jgi:hypothetical protein
VVDAMSKVFQQHQRRAFASHFGGIGPHEGADPLLAVDAFLRRILVYRDAAGRQPDPTGS